MPVSLKLPTMKCPHCRNEWIVRVAAPKRCPGCGRKLAT